MRIAIYYHNHLRNDGPPLYYLNVLRNQMGLDVVHLLPEGDTTAYGKFDLHFWVDYGEDSYIHNIQDWHIPNDGGKTIYVCSDAHIDSTGFNYRLNRAKEFDYVFVNQVRFIDEFKRGGVENPMFLPHAAEPQAYPKFPIVKKWDVGFIGHVQDVKNHNGFSRVDFLDRMFREFPNFYYGVRTDQDPKINVFEDASKKYGQSRIVLNIAIKDDINMRNFEIASSGSFQLTNYIPTLDEVFEDGKHLVTYKTLDEAVEKAKYYLEHEDEREKIALAGHEYFMKNHTYRHRIEKIFDVLGVANKAKTEDV